MLRPLQEVFDPLDSPDLLVGLGQADDAAIWRLDEKRALVVSTDFFTPVVDDPYRYGAIAAANSLSDVYAMGGEPFLALNIVGMPNNLPLEVIREIIRGGAEKAHEAGVVIAGGHTVQDEEPKYGLVVLGFVDPEGTITKSGARPGDRLVLTKPLGFGVTTTALKQGLTSDDEVLEVSGWMARLNKDASRLAREFGIRSGTDVTGFSLLGHGWEMAFSSKVGLQFDFERIPFLSCAQKYAAAWTFPGGTADNRNHFSPFVAFDAGIEEASQMLLFDAQTSGGLLLAVPPEKLKAFTARAKELEQPVWVVGEVVEGNKLYVK